MVTLHAKQKVILHTKQILNLESNVKERHTVHSSSLFAFLMSGQKYVASTLKGALEHDGIKMHAYKHVASKHTQISHMSYCCREGSHIDMVYVYVPAFWGTFSRIWYSNRGGFH